MREVKSCTFGGIGMGKWFGGIQRCTTGSVRVYDWFGEMLE